MRGRLHVLAVSLSRGRGPWHPSDRGLVGPQSLSEQRYLQQSTTVCSAHIRLRKYEMKEGMLPVSYQLTMPSALDFHLLTACRTNSGSWEIERAGVLMIDWCAMTACKVVSSDVSGKVLPASLVLTGVAGCWSIHLNLIPKRRNIHDPTLPIIYYCYYCFTAKLKSPCSLFSTVLYIASPLDSKTSKMYAQSDIFRVNMVVYWPCAEFLESAVYGS